MLLQKTKTPTLKNRLFPQGFTLVELIVVITILAILGTIGFLSVGGYSSRARDTDRLADVGNISKSLDLSIVTAGSYPAPDNSFAVTYSGSTVWNQGIVGSTVLQWFRSSIAGGGLNKRPVDPLDGGDYVYSSLAEGKAYQIMADYEGDLPTSAMNVPSFVETAHATPGAPTIAYLRGNYGGIAAKVSSGTTVYVLAIPSIITNTGTVVGGSIKMDVGNSLSGTLLINGKNLKNANSYNPGAATALAYSGAKTAVNPSGLPATQTEYANLITSLKNAYTGSVELQTNSAIANLLSSTGTTAMASLGSAIVSGQLGGNGGATVDVSPETPLYTFVSHTFTNCGQSGGTGPSLASCRGSYGAGVPWTQDTTNNYLNMSTNGIQEWKVPSTATYTIDAYGAQGGNSSGGGVGGYGARMKGDFALTKWQVVRILVGQIGAYGSYSCAGGGGATYVTTSANAALVVAGGGGAAYSSSAGAWAYTTNPGNTNGGSGAASGAGLTGDGSGDSWIGPSKSFTNGGVVIISSNGDAGGFGGGGNTHGNCGTTYAGGGGYSGGNGATSSNGGYSYNSGTNQTNAAAANSGFGRVIITKL